jgi:hypothetical protein
MAHAKKMLCRVLVVTMLALPMPGLQAQTPLERADLTAKLEALGVAPAEASKRVDAMTDEEVALLAQGLADAPAGGALLCFACFAKLLILAIPVAAIGYLIFNLLAGKKPEAAEQPKPPAAETAK